MSNSGIKEACVWHDVLGFNVLDQVGVDIMHDLLEGVCKYDLSFLILNYVQDLKLFSYKFLMKDYYVLIMDLIRAANLQFCI